MFFLDDNVLEQIEIIIAVTWEVNKRVQNEFVVLFVQVSQVSIFGTVVMACVFYFFPFFFLCFLMSRLACWEKESAMKFLLIIR